GAIHRTTFGTCADIIEHQFVCALLAVPVRKFDDLANDPVVAEAHALDDLAVANVEAGDYAFCRNSETSSPEIRPSSSARPVIAAAQPRWRNDSRSARCRTPPEA